MSTWLSCHVLQNLDEFDDRLNLLGFLRDLSYHIFKEFMMVQSGEAKGRKNRKKKKKRWKQIKEGEKEYVIMLLGTWGFGYTSAWLHGG